MDGNDHARFKQSTICAFKETQRGCSRHKQNDYMGQS